jgi:hypothetical protein
VIARLNKLGISKQRVQSQDRIAKQVALSQSTDDGSSLHQSRVQSSTQSLTCYCLNFRSTNQQQLHRSATVPCTLTRVTEVDPQGMREARSRGLEEISRPGLSKHLFIDLINQFTCAVQQCHCICARRCSKKSLLGKNFSWPWDVQVERKQLWPCHRKFAANLYSVALCRTLPAT